ncbi:MAG: hypothetical protein C0504_18345 [Candidatus Solibacter sp.]|nr:hypothetical protein [Candidatus Solibacter sp.]
MHPLSRWIRSAGAAVLCLTYVYSGAPASAQQVEPPETALEQQEADASGQNCSYRNDPQGVELQAYRARQDAYERVVRFSKGARQAARSVSPDSIPRVNFVDEHIFDRLKTEGVASAALASDETFLRRVMLDLTGRIPTVKEIREFAADTSAGKRSGLIDRLLNSPEFNDKWTMWLGDLLGNAQVNSNRNLQFRGRNAFHFWMKEAIEQRVSFRDIAYGAIVGAGRNYDQSAGGTNFMVRSFHTMGPAQDTYDMMLVRTATAFLGMSHYDCILCHDGRRHLDTISLWGAAAKRADAQKMASHFSRTTMTAYKTSDTTEYYYLSFLVDDVRNGSYGLNTSSGNRPNRTPATVDGVTTASYTPAYRNGKVPAAGRTWRESFHAAMAEDELFAVNFANRLWKAMFGLGLVDPVDTLDPARLDPKNPPPAPWELQASHPQLLADLAHVARGQDFSLREFLRVLAESSAYQLDSAYDGAWDITKASLFARHIPRRIEGEEFHDALMAATQTLPANRGYTVEGWGDMRVAKAVQLPEPVEPRSNRAVAQVMDTFSRGNRDTVPRSQSGSILLQLNVMNNALITERIRQTGGSASPFITGLTRNENNGQVVEELFLAFLSRPPSEYERGVAMKQLTGKSGAARNTAIEDLAWSLVNKIDFIYSY